MKKFSLLLILFMTLPVVSHAQSIDLLWQGETYTPPFYQGRALWSKQSRITLVAIPHGLGSRSSLRYKWSKNGTVLGSVSGVGRDVLIFSDTILSKPQSILVEIVSGNDTVLASDSLILTPSNPILAVYENHPLYGFMFHQAISEKYKLEDREVTFTAFPLFFSALTRMDNILDYQWSTNAGNTGIESSATYRSPDNTTGSSEITVQVSSPDKIMQNAKKSFLVEFDNSINNI